jgi:hypothetical protein
VHAHAGNRRQERDVDERGSRGGKRGRDLTFHLGTRRVEVGEELPRFQGIDDRKRRRDGRGLCVDAEHDISAADRLHGRHRFLDPRNGSRGIGIPTACDHSLRNEIGGDRRTRLPQPEQGDNWRSHFS